MKKNPVLEGMQQRYATKLFDANQKLSQPQIEELLEILRLAPSSINAQPWHYTVVSNPTLKSELAKASYINEDKVNRCSHLIVFEVETDLEAFAKRLEKDLPEQAFAYYRDMLIPMGEETIKNWMIHQIYLAMGVALNACASLAIDACPMEGIDRNEYARILELEDSYPVVGLALGIRDPKDYNQPHITPKSRQTTEEIFDLRD